MKSRKISWHFVEFSDSISRTVFCHTLDRKRILYGKRYDADRDVYLVELSAYSWHLCCVLLDASEKERAIEELELLTGFERINFIGF